METTHAKPTVNAVLGIMKPGIRYTVERLAVGLGASPSSIQQLLATAGALARLDMHHTRRGRRYSLAGTSRAPGAHVDARIRPDFTSHLTGYMRALDAHRALAMTTRGGR